MGTFLEKKIKMVQQWSNIDAFWQHQTLIKPLDYDEAKQKTHQDNWAKAVVYCNF